MAEDESQPWWRGGVIYQVYPRSFQDTSADGIGDLKGITRRIPYIASLGVEAIWLSPFFKSPMDDMGYDVSDYCDVDPMFGTLADFDELLAAAHDAGLKVIIDQVLSHSSDRHPWFMESRSSRDNPKADWYVWADPNPDGTPPNNWLSIFGGPGWEWDSTRRQYYMHNFLTTQPDFNFHNPEVQDALLGTVRFWLERGVDGFRLDTANFYFHDRQLRSNPPYHQHGSAFVPGTNPYTYQTHLYDKTQPENLEFLKRLRALLDQYDDRAMVGEIADEDRGLRTVAAYTSGGDKLHMCYTFDLLSAHFSPTHFRKSVLAFETEVHDGWICWSFSNHDVMRHLSRWLKPEDNPARLAKFSIWLLLSLKGSICIYQGEELGLEQAELAFEDLRDPYGIRFWPGFKGRDGCRTPMVWEHDRPAGGFTEGKPWLPVPEAHRARAVDLQEADKNSVLNCYRDALAFRSVNPALVSGDIDFVDIEDDDLLVFRRRSSSQQILCVFNFTRAPKDWTVPTDFHPVRLLHQGSGQKAFSGSGTLQLEALDWAFIGFQG